MTRASFTTKIYSFRLFDDLILIYPLYAVMFSDRGVSLFEISILLFVWSFTAFVLEIPSGVLADRYSRKNLLVIGQLARAIGYLFWLFMPNFFGFLIGFVLWGVKSALTSGTFEALVYDELKQAGSQKAYAKVIGRAESFASLGIILAGAGAFGVAGVASGYTIIMVLSIAAVLVSAFSVALLPPARRQESTEETDYVSHLKAGLRLIKSNSLVAKLLLFAGFGLSVGAVDEYFGLFYADVGLTNSQIGLWDAIASTAGVVGGFAAYKFERMPKRVVAAMLVVLGGLLIIGGLAKSPVAMLAITAFVLVYRILMVVFDARIQHAIEDRTRATVSSVQGFLSETGALSVFLVFGWISQMTSNGTALAVFGAGIVVAAVLFALVKVGRKQWA